MKKKFLDTSMRLIKNSDKKYSQDDLDMIAYGLEGLYLTFSKLIVIFGVAYLLGLLKETLILLLMYNIIRSQAFGIHATKSIYCLISSTILFLGGALICKYVVFPIKFLIICSLICNICIILYAPADTYKRPLINKRKRIRFKLISSILGIIYTIIIIVFHDYSIVNYLLIGMLVAVISILPITYKIFGLPYNNYKTYKYGV